MMGFPSSTCPASALNQKLPVFNFIQYISITFEPEKEIIQTITGHNWQRQYFSFCLLINSWEIQSCRVRADANFCRNKYLFPYIGHIFIVNYWC